MHADKYYSLTISIFKSLSDAKILEQLWSTYWRQTLIQSPLINNRLVVDAHLKNIADKVHTASLVSEQQQQQSQQHQQQQQQQGSKRLGAFETGDSSRGPFSPSDQSLLNMSPMKISKGKSSMKNARNLGTSESSAQPSRAESFLEGAVSDL